MAITTAPYYDIRLLYHTNDFFLTATEISIDEQYVFGQMSQGFPDVYRGGLPGEVYISSWFPDNTYKVSFSADTGYTFRHVYISDVHPPGATFYPHFMSDREPGDFYIFQRYEVADANPLGWHIKLCIDYYRDYGEILEATFCHDLTRDYEYEEVICEHTTDLSSEIINANSIQLQWSNTAENIRGYHIYRNNTCITSEMLTNTIYLDENLSDGVYEYYVRSYYQEGCVSDSSNHVIVKIGEETCEPVNDLVAEKINNNAILLAWTKPENDLEIEGYHVYSNEQLQTMTLISNTNYLDENLPVGKYEYYVVTYYTNDCISDISNIVKAEIEDVGIVETQGIASVRIYPNPTSGEWRIDCSNGACPIVEKIEFFDVFGRSVDIAHPPLRGGDLGGTFTLRRLFCTNNKGKRNNNKKNNKILIIK
jgi:hypothetical protein